MAIASIDDGRGRRLAAIDIARGLAIVAMVVYHIAFDLSSFRLIATDVPSSLGWMIFARLIAGTFLFLVGVNLVLATRHGIVWPAYVRRLALIVGAALLVTLATWWFEPGSFVFFGILHAIAVASVLALPFLGLPSAAVALAAVFLLALPWFFVHPVFNAPALVWTGLASEPPVSVDFVPLFPWFGVVLAGIVAGRYVAEHRDRIAAWRPAGSVADWLTFAGRWSLVIYVVHQPLIVGALSLAEPYIPRSEAVARANFMGECRAACLSDRDTATCEAFCGCMFDGLWQTPLFAMSSFAEMSPDQRDTFDDLFIGCSETPATPIPETR